MALWADLTGSQADGAFGISAYEEAEGVVWPSANTLSFEATWASAERRLPKRKRELQVRWSRGLSGIAEGEGVEVAVYALRFNGNKPNWQGGGKLAEKMFVEPALEFLSHTPGPSSRLDAAWRFPRPESADALDGCRTGVRKPAITVRVPRVIPNGTSIEAGLATLVADFHRIARFLEP